MAAFQTRFAHLAEEFCKPVAERAHDKTTSPQTTPPDELALRSNLAVPK
jgi:neutral ceramidase